MNKTFVALHELKFIHPRLSRASSSPSHHSFFYTFYWFIYVLLEFDFPLAPSRVNEWATEKICRENSHVNQPKSQIEFFTSRSRFLCFIYFNSICYWWIRSDDKGSERRQSSAISVEFHKWINTRVNFWIKWNEISTQTLIALLFFFYISTVYLLFVLQFFCTINVDITLAADHEALWLCLWLHRNMYNIFSLFS